MPLGRYTCGVQWHIVLDGDLWSPREGEIWGLNTQRKLALAYLWFTRGPHRLAISFLPNYYGHLFSYVLTGIRPMSRRESSLLGEGLLEATSGWWKIRARMISDVTSRLVAGPGGAGTSRQYVLIIGQDWPLLNAISRCITRLSTVYTPARDRRPLYEVIVGWYGAWRRRIQFFIFIKFLSEVTLLSKSK